MTERESPWKTRAPRDPNKPRQEPSRQPRQDFQPRRDQPKRDYPVSDQPAGQERSRHERSPQDSAPRVYRERPAVTESAAADAPQGERRNPELRIHGVNALSAVFAKRPEAIRKLYLLESRIPQLQPLLKWCVANRVGYRIVEETDLQKLAASAHHEGVVADVLRSEPQPLTTWLRDLSDGPQCALWLDGVGNPHNLGAILRSAAHFGIAAVLLPKHSTLAMSGAAARVAEGGAEMVPFVRLGRDDNAIAQLHGAGFQLAATVVRGGSDVFKTTLPQRLVYVLGAEGEGMSGELASACDLKLSIPGSGAVDSLNVSAACAVLLSRWANSSG